MASTFVFDVDVNSMPDVKQGGKVAKPKKAEPVFKHYQGLTIAGLEKSISEAEGRFGNPETGNTPKPKEQGGKSGVVRKADASVMWRLSGEPNGGVDEDISISLKCGSRNKLEVFPKFKRVKKDGKYVREAIPGEMAKDWVIKSDRVIPELKRLLKAVKGMSRGDNGLGDLFYAEAYKIAETSRAKSIQKGEIRFDKESDCWVNKKTGQPA